MTTTCRCRCRSSLYALLAALDRGEHTTGDATSRCSHANSPNRAFSKIVALYPGEEVQLDSTPLDAMAYCPMVNHAASIWLPASTSQH